jgi:ADP-heptose:LPS heptosyltransferase
MYIKKLFYKLTNKDKHFYYKMNLKKAASIKQNVKLFKTEFEKKIINIQKKIESKKELSFLHYGHLGDVVNSLPIVKELSKTHKCNFYIQAKKPLEPNARHYKRFGDHVFLTKTNVDMLLPLFMKQPYIHKVDKYTNQEIDIDLNLIREMPINHDLDSVRWYFQLTGVHSDLSVPYLFVVPHKVIKNKVVIIRNARRKNSFTNYKFLKKYENLLFIGLNDEYEDLKKEVPNLEFYDCKDFLEMAQIIKSSKLFLGNLSFGYTIAEGLKIPRLLEAGPDFPVVYPNGKNAYDFYFQEHFEKWFSHLYYL